MGSLTVVAVPLEEYLTTSYEPDCEWVDGELEERAMPDDDHSALQVFFIAYFVAMRLELGVRVRAELRVKVAPRRYRIPDVALISVVGLRQAIPDKPPMLCIEILSPEDRMSGMQAKLADYVAMGVEAIWIVDPKRRTLFRADADGVHPVEMLTLAGTGVRLTGAEIFAELDELEAGTE